MLVGLLIANRFIFNTHTLATVVGRRIFNVVISHVRHYPPTIGRIHPPSPTTDMAAVRPTAFLAVHEAQQKASQPDFSLSPNRMILSFKSGKFGV